MRIASCLAGVVTILLAAGCTPSARQDVGKAGADLDSAASKSADATGQAIDQADKKVTADAKAAGHDVANGFNGAVQSTEQATAKAGSALKTDAQVASLTPKVKSAILDDDTVKIKDLNIDTHGDSKQVVVNGVATNAASHQKAIADARSVITKDAPEYQVVDHLK